MINYVASTERAKKKAVPLKNATVAALAERLAKAGFTDEGVDLLTEEALREIAAYLDGTKVLVSDARRTKRERNGWGR